MTGQTKQPPQVKQISFLDTRFYTVGALTFPSVTTVLSAYPKSDHFLNWLKNNGRHSDIIVNELAKVGTQVHNGIENVLNGEELDAFSGKYSREVWELINNGIRFIKSHNVKPLFVERRVICPEVGTGGTIDLIAEIVNPEGITETWLLDWKTSTAVFNTHKIQQATYFKIWNSQAEAYGLPKIDRVGLIHLRANPRKAEFLSGRGFKVHEVKNLDHYFKLFELTYQLWAEENKRTKPDNIYLPAKISL